MTKLSESYAELAAQAQGIAASIDRLNLEIISIESRMFDSSAPGYGSGRDMEQYQQKTTYRDQLRSQYSILDRKAAMVKQQAAEVELRRQADVARYQKATGQLIAESDALRKWKQLLDKKEAQLGKAKKGSTPQARAIRRKLTAFSTYVPLEPAVERQRLLEALAEDLEAVEIDAAAVH